MDHPICTEYFRWSNPLENSSWMVSNAVSSFVMRSPVTWNMAVPPDDTTVAYKFLRVSASHFTMNWKEVSWNPRAHLSMKLGWDNTFAQRKRLAPTVVMFPSGSSEVFSLSFSAVDLSSLSGSTPM